MSTRTCPAGHANPETQRFCGECHARLGLAQISAPRARTGRFHPPSFVDAHGEEARRAMTQCASCHVEQDCVACHGALGIGAGFSPHPPGFASRCGRALEQNQRACTICHGDAAALRARCGG